MTINNPLAFAFRTFNMRVKGKPPATTFGAAHPPLVRISGNWVVWRLTHQSYQRSQLLTGLTCARFLPGKTAATCPNSPCKKLKAHVDFDIRKDLAGYPSCFSLKDHSYNTLYNSEWQISRQNKG